jgi:hypothetical protein
VALLLFASFCSSQPLASVGVGAWIVTPNSVNVVPGSLLVSRFFFFFFFFFFFLDRFFSVRSTIVVEIRT